MNGLSHSTLDMIDMTVRCSEAGDDEAGTLGVGLVEGNLVAH